MRARAAKGREGRRAEAEPGAKRVRGISPLPPDHAFWSQPNCFITPHTAGGRHDQDTAIVQHFLHNLAAFQAKGKMVDRVV